MRTVAKGVTFYCIVTCGCGHQEFDRKIDDFYETAILKCTKCGLEYRQPAVKYVPLLVQR